VAQLQRFASQKRLAGATGCLEVAIHARKVHLLAIDAAVRAIIDERTALAAVRSALIDAESRLQALVHRARVPA
jgi:hypothetical protein